MKSHKLLAALFCALIIACMDVTAEAGGHHAHHARHSSRSNHGTAKSGIVKVPEYQRVSVTKYDATPQHRDAPKISEVPLISRNRYIPLTVHSALISDRDLERKTDSDKLSFSKGIAYAIPCIVYVAIFCFSILFLYFVFF